MKSYLKVLKQVTHEFLEDLGTVPFYALRAILHLCGCVFILGFIFICPVFLPVYAYVEWKNKRIAKHYFDVTHDFVSDYRRGKFFQ